MSRLWFIFALLCPFALTAFDNAPPCYRDLERNFYTYQLVAQGLAMYQVPQNAWDLVYRSIEQRMQSLPGVMKSKASKMRPNPFQRPFNAKAIEEMLSHELYEILVASLRDNQVANPQYAQGMFQYIKGEQQQKWDACFGEGR